MENHLHEKVAPVEHAEKLLELIRKNVRERLGAGRAVMNHLAAALHAATNGGTGACIIGNQCYDNYSALNCSGVNGSYAGDGSFCAT